jgi:hypothetical protein
MTYNPDDNNKPRTNEELLKVTVEYLEDSVYKFALFVDHFKRYLERSTKLQEVKK